MDGLSRIYPNQREEQATLGYGVVPGTPAEGYALTQANFPCALEAFTSDGISGNNNVGRFGHVTLTSSTGWTQPAAHQFIRTTGGTRTSSGAWTAIGTRHALQIVIGSLAAATAATFGDVTNGPGIPVLGNGSSFVTLDSGNYADTNALGGSPTYPIDAVAVLLDQTGANGATRKFGCKGGTSYGPTSGTVTGDISQSWPAIGVGSNLYAMNAAVPYYYTGIFLLAFTSLPPNALIADALIWMSEPGHEGLLYPGFYHLS